jgi:cytochrome c-type biogenesis protein
VSDWFESTALSGSMVLAVPVAILAGLVSFFSPCVIPLLPGYLSYATGLSGADLADSESTPHRGRMLAGSSLFVLGFSVVFVGLGVLSAGVSRWFFEYSRTFSIVLGVLAVVLGLVFMGLVPLFQRDVRVHKVPAVGLAAAPLLGVLFGLGWTPCIGPTLGVILTLAYDGESVTRGGILLAFYSLGLGVPFILAALAWRRALGAVGWMRRHQQWITRAGGLMLVLVGVLLLSGWWDQMVQWVQLNLVDQYQVSV